MAKGTVTPTPPMALATSVSSELRYKMALTSAAATLREATNSLVPPYQCEVKHLAELIEAMAGERQA